MKEAYYFSHDYNARNDPKMQKVLMKLGQSGKGVYWDLIEMLYEEGGYLMLSECDSYAFALRSDSDCIASLINDFDLFNKDNVNFWSESVLRRLDKRKEKSEKAAQSAQKRWNNANAYKSDANALRTECEGNALKERKGKEKKGKDNKDVLFLKEPKGDGDFDGSNTKTGGVSAAEMPQSKVKESKVNKSKEISSLPAGSKEPQKEHAFVKFFNEVTGRKFKGMSAKAERQLKALKKLHYSMEDFRAAIKNGQQSAANWDDPALFTPEYITREDKFLLYLNRDTPLTPPKQNMQEIVAQKKMVY